MLKTYDRTAKLLIQIGLLSREDLSLATKMRIFEDLDLSVRPFGMSMLFKEG